MKIIGITGGIGSGKSIICSIFEKMGFSVFYSDIVAKQILLTDIDVIQQLTNVIGPNLYIEGKINKELLANKIFKEEQVKLKVNQIIHPKVREYFDSWVSIQDSRLVFNEAAILFETGLYKKYDVNVLVTAPESIRINRSVLRDNSSKEVVKYRVNSQWTDEQKMKFADFIIVNDNLTPVLPQLEQILSEINI